MLRIAHILGKMNGGGIEQVVLNYCHAINRENVQFDFFLCKGSTAVPTEEIKALGGRIFVLPPLKKPLRYVRTLQRLLRENSYDIAHCHMGTLAAPALLAAKRAGVRVRILHNHTTSGGLREAVRNFAKLLLKPSAKLFATHYLACSQHAARWMFGGLPVRNITEQALPVKHVTILPNAIDTEKFRFDENKRRNIRSELKIPDSAAVYGHVGRFCPQKNQGFLIDVFKEIAAQQKNSVLLLVGAGKDMELIKARAIAAGIADRVLFTGQRTDIDRFYSAFDCFLLPSNYEGLGMVAVEAQCAGLYCLLSDNVPPEAKVTASAQFLPLKSGAQDWACAALCCSKIRSENGVEQITTSGYDILTAAKALEKFYTELYKVSPSGMDFHL